MEKEIKLSTKNVERAKTIKLSTNTHTLIQCRAMLNDIYGTVTDVVDARYGNQQDEILKDFRAEYSNFDYELCKLISMFIEVTSLQGTYEDGCFAEM